MAPANRRRRASGPRTVAKGEGDAEGDGRGGNEDEGGGLAACSSSSSGPSPGLLEDDGAGRVRRRTWRASEASSGPFLYSERRSVTPSIVATIRMPKASCPNEPGDEDAAPTRTWKTRRGRSRRRPSGSGAAARRPTDGHAAPPPPPPLGRPILETPTALDQATLGCASRPTETRGSSSARRLQLGLLGVVLPRALGAGEPHAAAVAPPHVRGGSGTRWPRGSSAGRTPGSSGVSRRSRQPGLSRRVVRD